MSEFMGDLDGFSLEDLAAEEQANQGQPVTQAQGVEATQPAQQQQPQVQVPLYSQQWQQWDAQRRAGNIQPLPAAPVMPQPAPSFPWSKVLVGAGIAAAVFYGVHLLRKKGKSKASNPKFTSGSWHTIGD